MPTSKSMQKLKENDLERYREIVREQKRRYRERHSDKIKKQNQRYKEKRKTLGLPANNTNLESYKENRRKNVLKRAEKIRNMFNNFKKEQKCCLCGEDEICCIDFHHVGADEKSDMLSKIMACKSISYNKVLTELNRCIPVCSNCHRKIHTGIIINLPKLTKISKEQLQYFE